MKGKKLLVNFLVVALILATNSIPAFATESMQEDNTTVLFTIPEIRDFDALVARAEAGVDDLKKATGVTVETDAMYVNSVQSRFADTNIATAELETLQTSQLIGAYEHNGVVFNQYAVTATVYEQTVSGEKSGMTVTIYFDTAESYFVMIRSSVSLNVFSGKNLQIMNTVAPDDTTYARSTNYKNYSYPSKGSTYSSVSPSSEGLHPLLGGMTCQATLSLDSGADIFVGMDVSGDGRTSFIYTTP